MEYEKKKITLEDIEAILKDSNFEVIGEIYPGCYRLPNGMYTGKKGWENFTKIVNDMFKCPTNIPYIPLSEHPIELKLKENENT